MIPPHTDPIEATVIISLKQNKPCIELRKSTTDSNTIKLLVSSAIHKQPLIIIPKFSNEIKSLSQLVHRGIIYQKGEQYYFNI